MSHPPKIQAVLDWYGANRKDFLPQVRKMLIAFDTPTALGLLILEGFEAGCAYQAKQPVEGAPAPDVKPVKPESLGPKPTAQQMELLKKLSASGVSIHWSAGIRGADSAWLVSRTTPPGMMRERVRTALAALVWAGMHERWAGFFIALSAVVIWLAFGILFAVKGRQWGSQ